jgi:ATP-dependent protease ClpP protease subunit
MSYRTIVIACVLALLPAARAAGDRVVLENGRTIDGRVVAEDAGSVTIQIELGSSTLTQRYNKSQVRSIARVERLPATYVTLPVVGAIGTDVTAAALRAGFNEARASSPKYVVLAIDSPGGEVREMATIVDLIAEMSKDVEVVALVKNAHSAAAVIAMTCPRIYMMPGATIGATVPFRITQSGPADVDAKMRSIIAAMMRAAIATGGHAELLIRGMSEIDLEIYLATDELTGAPVLRTSGPGKLIKQQGQILTLTADEAAECGLATRAANLAEVGKLVAGDAPWVAGPRRPWQVVTGHVALARWRAEQRFGDLKSRYDVATAGLRDLAMKHYAELQQIESDYAHGMREAQLLRNPQAAASNAKSTRDTRVADAQKHFQAQANLLESERASAAAEAKQLAAEHPELVTQLPRE